MYAGAAVWSRVYVESGVANDRPGLGEVKKSDCLGDTKNGNWIPVFLTQTGVVVVELYVILSR